MRLILTLTLLIIVCSLNAQNLPAIQKESIQAPAKIKIDGKIDEWSNKFEAFNKSTQIYYTISNDAANLYLTVQAIDFNTIKKILSGGITLTVNKANKKKDSTAIVVTFPVYERDQKSILLSNQWRADKKAQIDSFVNVYNRQIPTTVKLISVKGLNTINNGFISIYNNDKIKAAVRFDKGMHYNYELAIPLNLIELPPAGMSKFNYNIQINGQKTFNGFVIEALGGRPDILGFIDNNGRSYTINDSSQDKDLYYPTDFWGEYKLIK